MSYWFYTYWAERRLRSATKMKNAFNRADYEIAGTDAGYCLDRTEFLE